MARRITRSLGAVATVLVTVGLLLASVGARPQAVGESTARTVAAAAASPANAYAAVPVGVALTKTGRGFWVAEANGDVIPEGDAVFYGDPASVNLAGPITGISATPTGHGYWLLEGNGGVFSYGDAHFYSSAAAAGGLEANQPTLDMVPTATGNGYWLVSRDGGIWTFGGAAFHGSARPLHPPSAIVGMAATSGGGYWEVARDGGVYSFGATFHGSARPLDPKSPIVGLAATPDGGGYWEVERNGGIYSFGDALFHGSAATAPLPAPAIGVVPTANGGGYWVVLANGTVRSFGDATPLPSVGLVASAFSLVGEIITVDPGHNGDNRYDASYINQPVWNGREYESCDTTGTETAAGYTEAAFNFDVGTRLATILRSFGASVVMTRTTNTGVGPCVNVRAAIGNNAGSDADVFIHADGGPPGGRGFSVLLPVADGPNDGVIGSSLQLGLDVRAEFGPGTGEPVSDYYGVDGLQPRDDLAGLNLTTVPKILIESANMTNPTDAALTENPAWRQLAAGSLERGLSLFLTGGA
jgi:N-acetylmuramoyl-L-alanine amidase